MAQEIIRECVIRGGHIGGFATFNLDEVIARAKTFDIEWEC